LYETLRCFWDPPTAQLDDLGPSMLSRAGLERHLTPSRSLFVATKSLPVKKAFLVSLPEFISPAFTFFDRFLGVFPIFCLSCIPTRFFLQGIGSCPPPPAYEVNSSVDKALFFPSEPEVARTTLFSPFLTFSVFLFLSYTGLFGRIDVLLTWDVSTVNFALTFLSDLGARLPSASVQGFWK